MTAREIKDKAILVLIFNLILPGLGHIIAHREIAEALKRTGKDPSADPNAIKNKGIIQLILFLVGALVIGPITCGIGFIIPVAVWIWGFLVDTLINYYSAMTSVPEEDHRSGG
ncbi:MAG: hypothetical protein GXO39_04870 [Thermotogae bacterium]|nr:hypothetical protein [Thermotogota bacterium]